MYVRFSKKWIVLGAAFLAVVGGIALAQQPSLIYGVDTAGSVKPVQLGFGNRICAVEPLEVKQSTQIIGDPLTGCASVEDPGCTVILSPIDLSTWPNVTIQIKGGKFGIDQVILEWSPDGISWEKWDDSTFASLPPDTLLSMAIAGNSRKFLRAEAHVATASTTTAVVWVNANR